VDGFTVEEAFVTVKYLKIDVFVRADEWDEALSVSITPTELPEAD